MQAVKGGSRNTSKELTSTPSPSRRTKENRNSLLPSESSTTAHFAQGSVVKRTMVAHTGMSITDQLADTPSAPKNMETKLAEKGKRVRSSRRSRGDIPSNLTHSRMGVAMTARYSSSAWARASKLSPTMCSIIPRVPLDSPVEHVHCGVHRRYVQPKQMHECAHHATQSNTTQHNTTPVQHNTTASLVGRTMSCPVHPTGHPTACWSRHSGTPARCSPAPVQH